MKSKIYNKLLAVILVGSMCCTVLSQYTRVNAQSQESDGMDGIMSEATQEAVKADILYNPVYNYETGQMEFSYIYFGCYPQSEVTGAALTEELVNAEYVSGEAVVDGVKYRRLKEEEAYYSYAKYLEDSPKFGAQKQDFYDWGSDGAYHYFRYEPIKWRVIEKEDGKALLLADVILDHHVYHNSGRPSGVYVSDAWLISDIRMWLNHYKNTRGSFLTTAFTEEEQQLMCERFLGYEDCWVGTVWEGYDKVFLLETFDLYCAGMIDQVSPSMCISDYAFANGLCKVNVTAVDSAGRFEEGKRYGNWWLRDEFMPTVACVDAVGDIHDERGFSDCVSLNDKSSVYPSAMDVGVCPAIWLDLSNESLWEAEAPLTQEEVARLEAYVPTPTPQPTSTPRPTTTPVSTEAIEPSETVLPSEELTITEEPSEVPQSSPSPEISKQPQNSESATGSASPVPTQSASTTPEPSVIMGDVDNNGKVELNDAQIVLKAALKITGLTQIQFQAADIDTDNQITLTDAQKILKLALKIIQ